MPHPSESEGCQACRTKSIRSSARVRCAWWPSVAIGTIGDPWVLVTGHGCSLMVTDLPALVVAFVRHAPSLSDRIRRFRVPSLSAWRC